jgi:hypothetical protein
MQRRGHLKREGDRDARDADIRYEAHNSGRPSRRGAPCQIIRAAGFSKRRRHTQRPTRSPPATHRRANAGPSERAPRAGHLAPTHLLADQ